MIDPRLPNPDYDAIDVNGLGSPHAQIRDTFLERVRALTDVAIGTETVIVDSSILRELGHLATEFAWDHSGLERNTKVDAKTGLINFATAEEEIEGAINDRARQSDREPGLRDIPLGSFAFFDIDNFKHVNSILTNPVADELVIRNVGKSLNQSMNGTRRRDLAMKHGGDEFGIWFNDILATPENVTNAVQLHLNKVFEAARKLQDDVNQALHDPSKGLTPGQLDQVGTVTFSFGFAYPTLAQIEQVQQQEGISASSAVFKLANMQEELAKADKSTTTVAVAGKVYDVADHRLLVG